MRINIVGALLALSLLLKITAYAQDFGAVDKWLKDNTELMGGRTYLMIYKDGKYLYSKGYENVNARQRMAVRMMNRRGKTDIDLDAFWEDSKIGMASCSKWLSAALVMTFVDEGRLSLNDTVGKYLPILAEAGKGRITIWECFSHLTGIRAPDLKDNLKEMQRANTMDDAMREVAAMPMEGEPGKVFRYSNAGLQIAAAVLEKISGQSFQQLFAERIAKPLDMKNTDWGIRPVALPAGGARSTPMDYMHFLVMILNKGSYNGHRVLSEKAVADMQVNRLGKDVQIAYSPAEAAGFGYAFGEWVFEQPVTGRPTQVVSSPGLFGSFPWVSNDGHYCAFMMTYYLNSQGRNQRYKTLKSLVDQALKAGQPN